MEAAEEGAINRDNMKTEQCGAPLQKCQWQLQALLETIYKEIENNWVF